MADRVNGPKQPVRAADEHAADAPLPAAVAVNRGRSAGSESSPHSQKFRAATATLVGVALGALVIALTILASSGGSGPSAKWSSWKPLDNGTLGAREIADHIAPFYRISAVDQLAVVTVANISGSAAATTSTSASSSAATGLQVAVRENPSSSAVSVLTGNTIGYNLCGIGAANCAIRAGTPSADRLLLLRREALELALYTFKYISGVQNVIAILPPGHAAATLTAKPPSASKPASQSVDVAVLFLRDELKPWLNQPLSSTLPEQFPPPVPELSLWKQTTEAGLVDQITARGLFSEHVVQAQDGSKLIVLDPMPPQ
jgi:hypothetical protein